MALSFTKFSWLWLGGKEKEPPVSNGGLVNSKNSVGDWGLGLRGESETLKFYSVKEVDSRMPSNRKVKRKWKSREERGKNKNVDREYDVVLVPSDGVCLSGSESDDSDWSIGWMEPHAPDFQSDDVADDSFAVLVPCYRHDIQEANAKEETSGVRFFNGVKNLPVDSFADGTNYMEQWLSSLQNF